MKVIEKSTPMNKPILKNNANSQMKKITLSSKDDEWASF